AAPMIGMKGRVQSKQCVRKRANHSGPEVMAALGICPRLVKIGRVTVVEAVCDWRTKGDPIQNQSSGSDAVAHFDLPLVG
ncbi:hypothetical protein, partial [Sphingobium abikonense]|uniref:hypothetical protein n=1 Tax=Sphingobium abikonense TaxID=86193 RepID=UPI001C3F4E59